MMKRSKRGNMLALVAITALLMVVVMMFGLSFLSLSRGNMEQRTAAEAAALTAAQEVGKIVVKTECGYVGLCDLAPIGTTTLAKDNFYCEVRSINELLATARLQLIIAKELNDPFLKALALEDRSKALAAEKLLKQAVIDALKPNGVAKDINGNTLTPYADAEAIYKKNGAKMSEYVGNSLKITLGFLDGGIATQVPTPNPNEKAALSPGNSIGGCYVSDSNIPFDSSNFVFASTGKQTALADLKKFKETISGVSEDESIPVVIKIDADQIFHEQGKDVSMHFAACATTGSDIHRPAPGALTISFPDGAIAEIDSPDKLYGWSEMQNSKCDVLTSKGGDFPVDKDPQAILDANLPYTLPTWPAGAATAGDLCKLGIHDWLRAGGSKVNVSSVVNMLSSKLDPPSKDKILWISKDPKDKKLVSVGTIPQGIAHIYTFKEDGSILYRSKDIVTAPYTVVAENQLYAESLQGQDIKSPGTPEWIIANIKLNVPQKGLTGLFKENEEVVLTGKQQFDFYMRDMVRQAGADKGGKHEGEPMDSDLVALKNKGGSDKFGHKFNDDNFEVGGKKPHENGGSGIPSLVSRQDDFATTSLPAPDYYKYAPGTTAPRPTYVKNGVCVEFRFRRQVNVGLLAALIGDYDIGYVGEVLTTVSSEELDKDTKEREKEYKEKKEKEEKEEKEKKEKENKENKQGENKDENKGSENKGQDECD